MWTHEEAGGQQKGEHKRFVGHVFIGGYHVLYESVQRTGDENAIAIDESLCRERESDRERYGQELWADELEWTYALFVRCIYNLTLSSSVPSFCDGASAAELQVVVSSRSILFVDTMEALRI